MGTDVSAMTPYLLASLPSPSAGLRLDHSAKRCDSESAASMVRIICRVGP